MKEKICNNQQRMSFIFNKIQELELSNNIFENNDKCNNIKNNNYNNDKDNNLNDGN